MNKKQFKSEKQRINTSDNNRYIKKTQNDYIILPKFNKKHLNASKENSPTLKQIYSNSNLLIKNGFLTEYPLNYIFDKKMIENRKNITINYDNNIKNTSEKSKKFRYNNYNEDKIKKAYSKNLLTNDIENNFFYKFNGFISEDKEKKSRKKLLFMPANIKSFKKIIKIEKLDLKTEQNDVDNSSSKSDKLANNNITLKEIQMSPKLKSKEIVFEKKNLSNESLSKFELEQYQETNKLDRRRQIFRKYSISKRERNIIIQNNSEENLKEKDFQNYIEKRKEYEVYYEDELLKTNYFDENSDVGYKLEQNNQICSIRQRDVNGLSKVALIQEKKKNKKEIIDKINKLNKKFINNDDCESSKLRKNDPLFRGKEDILTIRELKYFKKEFIKDIQLKNLDKLVDIVKCLKFFTKFPYSLCKEIIKNSNIVSFNCGEKIFNQGEIGDSMYIILKGSVNVRIKSKTKTGYEFETIINSLYDGDHFGDLALMGTKQKDSAEKKDIILESIKQKINKKSSDIFDTTSIELKKGVTVHENNQQEQDDYYYEHNKRLATIEAGESCDLLVISKEYFKNSLMKLMQTEIDSKIKFLLTLQSLSNFEAYNLISLANVLTVKYYGIGEPLILEGKKPLNLQIIKYGSCKITKNQICTRDCQASLYSKAFKKKNLNFYFGKKEKIIDQREKKNYNENIVIDSKRLFSYSKTENPENELNKITYNELIEYGTIGEGDIIGGRSLFYINEIKNNNFSLPLISEITESKINVIADSNSVEVLVLERNNIENIPYFLKVALANAVENDVEFDSNINVEIDSPKFELWNIYKENYTKMRIKTDALTKNINNFYKPL